MIPAKIQNTFIELSIDFKGKIIAINSGNFCKKDFIINQSIYTICPFLEGTIESLTIDKSYSVDGMVLKSNIKEYNIEVELIKNSKSIITLIQDRTNIYQYIIQLNQNRNDISLVKEQISKQNIALEMLRKISDKANEEKSRFLAVMSHEVRNPLNSILAYADIILSETNNDEIKNYAHSLKSSGKNLNVIVDDILDISRIDAGKLELIKTPISLSEIIENCVKDFTLQYKEGSVKLSAKLPNSLPDFVLGDSVRINQILANLIKNAFKFTKKGQIIVEAILMSDEVNNCTINFKVQDSGRGMHKEQLASIFNEYEQTEVTDFAISKGAGLGLSIVKRLVETMQGSVKVESEVGVGSVFSFQIPFQKAKKIKAEVIDDKQVDLSSLKVLFADDDVLNQSIAKHFLNKENIISVIVNDGLEALEQLQSVVFDVVLLDIHMPNLSGEELVKKQELFLKENQQIPIVAVTANAALKDVLRYKSIGFTNVLSKPYNAKSLISAIQKSIK